MKNTDTIVEDIFFGPDRPPVVIAELSGNHNQSYEVAIDMVRAASKAGVKAIKLQTYTADTLTIDIEVPPFTIDDPKSLWHGRSLYDLYEQAYTPWDWHEGLMSEAKKLGMLCFSTPFDESAVEFLEQLDVPCFKIASFENNHIPLIEKVSQTGKPLMISTGLSDASDIADAVGVARANGCKDLVLMKCTSAYPTQPVDVNLSAIPHMAKMFDCPVGLSDHTVGIGAAIGAVALGATAIEKHMKLHVSDDTVDSEFSESPESFSVLVKEARCAWQAIGSASSEASIAEQPSKIFKRSIYAVEDMVAGAILTSTNTRIIRPSGGLAPKHWHEIIGREITKEVKRGAPITWDMFE